MAKEIESMRIKLSKSIVLTLTLSLSVSLFLCPASAAPPNIVVILTDDQGYADISLNPHHPKEVSTPHMDALAKEGVVFSQGYISGPVCSPTRAGFMLGRYQQRVGVYSAGDGGRGFDPKLPIFPSFLPEPYYSAALGKWHLGLDDDYPELKWNAVSRGFDEFYGFMGRGAHDYFNLRSDSNGEFGGPIYRNKTRINDKGYLTNRLSQEAVEFIDRNKERPFFLYLAYNAVHAPAEAPQSDIDFYQKKFPDITKERVILMAMLKHLDDGVGDVVAKLKKEGLFDNTLLFFLTDNGGAKAMQANNAPLRGFKGSLYEGGIRTPFIVSWPDKFKGNRTIDTPVISLDILPTVLDAIGVKAPAKPVFDGKSILPLLCGQTDKHHETLYWSTGDAGEWSVRRGDWKLHFTKGKKELIDLGKDPSEQTDVASEHPEIVKQLNDAYNSWLAEMADPITGGSKFWSAVPEASNEKVKRTREQKDNEKQARREQGKAEKRAEKKNKTDEDNNKDSAPQPLKPDGVSEKVPAVPMSDVPPSANFDLSHWKLTLPAGASEISKGKAVEISAAQLTTGYQSKYFHGDVKGAMVFWCPAQGATTEGTQFPRSELREMLDPNNPAINWRSSGTHTLKAQCRITQLPSYPKIVIGQIHSYSGKSKPLVKLQYYKGRIEALVKLSPTKGEDRKLTFPGVELNSDISWQLELQDGVLSVTVNGMTQQENIVQNDADWANQTFYFKAGAYPQDNEGPASEGTRVTFSQLKTSHVDKPSIRS
jgi:arylsulfatase A-like enzyme